MNTSLQLYNATSNQYMCPLWPEIPTLESVPTPLTSTTSTIFDTIKDYLPKKWDDMPSYLVDGYMVKECVTNVPYSCVSALAAKILPASKLSETTSISSQGHHFRSFLRYTAYKIEFNRQIRWLLPCVTRFDLPSCAKYHIDGGKSYALKVLHKGKMPKLLTLVLFVFKELLHIKAVETALSCAFEPWTECITNTAQSFIGIKLYKLFAEEE